MECLLDFIGLSETTETHGLTLISLPGVTLDNVKKIVSEGDNAYLAAWKEIQTRSIKKITTFCSAKLNECFLITDRKVIECLMCANKDLLAVALWYLEGVELMADRLYSDRVNRWTTIDRDEARELQAFFHTEFERELGFAVRGFNLSTDDCIKEEELVPNGTVRWTEVLP
jgi:hypothetical protein